MASQTMNLGKMKARKDYPNPWHRSLLHTVVADPCYCCFAFLCPLCASCSLRKRALYGDMSRYKCCGGNMACGACCGDDCCCPGCCLCMEVCLCFPISIAATRSILQDELEIENTTCDNCITGCMECLQLFGCIFCLVNCIFGISDSPASMALSCSLNVLICLVCVCMQTQHKIEMDRRDGHFGPPQVMAPPPVYQMSRID